MWPIKSLHLPNQPTVILIEEIKPNNPELETGPKSSIHNLGVIDEKLHYTTVSRKMDRCKKRQIQNGKESTEQFPWVIIQLVLIQKRDKNQAGSRQNIARKSSMELNLPQSLGFKYWGNECVKLSWWQERVSRWLVLIETKKTVPFKCEFDSHYFLSMIYTVFNWNVLFIELWDLWLFTYWLFVYCVFL